MLGQRGKTWLSTVTCLLIFTVAFWPVSGNAAESSLFTPTSWNLPIMMVAAQTPLEAQMTSEPPPAPPSFGSQALLQQICPGLQPGQPGTTLQLPHNFRVSFRYHGDSSTGVSKGMLQPPLLFRYSMDYCLLPNLQVGLSGFLYQPPGDQLSFLRRGSDDLVLGLGPSVRYDLGRWSFTFRSQVQRGGLESGKDLQNWLRVWYAF